MLNLDATDWNDLSAAQRTVNDWANRTFPGRKPESSLLKLAMEEIPELLIHRKTIGTEGIDEEIADCFILLLDLCEIWGVNLPLALRNKMIKNLHRTWLYDESTGFYNHLKGEEQLK